MLIQYLLFILKISIIIIIDENNDINDNMDI